MTRPGPVDGFPTDPASAAGPPDAPSERSHHPAARGRPSLGIVGVVALGGVLGTAARVGVSEALPTAAGAFPWATFWTNASGSFALGWVLTTLGIRPRAPRHARAFLATGFLGAYTTFSTFTVEAALLVRADHVARATAYGVATLVVGLAAAGLGIAAGGRPRRVA